MPWCVSKVPGKGNCFFHVVASHVYGASSDDLSLMRQVRTDLADHIAKVMYGTTVRLLTDAVWEDSAYLGPMRLATLDANVMLTAFDTSAQIRDGGSVPLWAFAVWLQFDELAIERSELKRVAQSFQDNPGTKTWNFLKYTLWGDAAFIASVTTWCYKRHCEFRFSIDEERPPSVANNIVFLHTEKPPHFDALRWVSRVIRPTLLEALPSASSQAQKIAYAVNVFAQVIDRLDVTAPCSQSGSEDDGMDVDEDEDEDEDEDAVLSAHFLDVGMGDGTFIVCPDGTSILVDLGSTMNDKSAGSDAITFLVSRLMELRNERNLTAPQIDQLYLTHSDADHYNLLGELCRRVRENAQCELVICKVIIGGKASEYRETTTAFNDDPSQKGQSFNLAFFQRYKPTELQLDYHEDVSTQIGDVSITILSANVDARKARRPNPNSIVLYVGYAGRGLILMGDAEEEVEESILQHYANALKVRPAMLCCDVLKMGHHGSKAGTTKAWLAVTQPRRIIVSADMQWSHPYESTMSRAISSGSLVEDYEHSYLAGTGGISRRSYVQSTTKLALYSTISRMEKGPAPTVDPKKKGPRSSESPLQDNHVLVTGVQYEWDVFSDGTDRWADTLGGIGDEFLCPENMSDDDVTDGTSKSP